MPRASKTTDKEEDDDPMEIDGEEEEDTPTTRTTRRRASSRSTSNPASPASSSENEDGDSDANVQDDGDDEDEELEDVVEEEDDDNVAKRRSTRRRNNPKAKQKSKDSNKNRRTSSRSTKFASSMAEPSAKDMNLLASDDDDDDKKKTGKSVSKKDGGRRGQKGVRDSLGKTNNHSPNKTPARRHAKARLSMRPDHHKGDDDESSYASDESGSEEDDEDESDEEEPVKIQRIIASRSETIGKWREICRGIQTSEIEYGSRWFQQDDREDIENDNDGQVTEMDETKEAADGDQSAKVSKRTDKDDVFEERFLVKWKDLSYLHCSWETQNDLESQVEGAKTYLSTFFRKSEDGLLFSADERADGDYFDPGFVQIDRILEVHLPEDEGDYPPLTADKEDEVSPDDYGIILDRSNPKFEDGTGRQFLIKWSNLPYSESTYEFERDLMLNEVEYKGHLKAFLQRNTKPTKSKMSQHLKKGEATIRKLYKVLGDRSNISQSDRDKAVEEYQKELQEKVYKNGGQLRDYQAEGVAWMVSNYVNNRCSILADEMGLGKTLQTAAITNILLTQLCRNGPVLIVAPLSTLAHWSREFQAWTDLNVVVYHGSAEDRDVIREHEFVYECDRPVNGVAFNQTYLKKCCPKRLTQAESPWMAQVVITTPEMVVCDDAVELEAVQWEALVVDEAHRLKNHNSKLTVKLRQNKFKFKHKILLTGTPIQNDVQEFWTLLNFIDPDSFDDMDEFMEKYGDLKSKETIDELHDEIRPYILRRLKEDVEKSVPPKEETLIEVELTVSQKQYYRALYEKNVSFLHKNKRALDGPSLNNLAMQLRKCCNHLFLLNGVEDEFRAERAADNISEGDLLVKASGKLVLLDKLLPRLKEQGHRILVFSQFKIMLDILEDFFEEREMKFERIDGSITGNKRQQAIDRFQAPAVEGKESPFIMMLSTRAGGVGINLTAADTVIIFDSDFNPQNDLQAQARCHRIGQTKSVKIYRLLTRKTYEMQMFHMSSLKMGLDQAVLKGFESGSSGEGALSKSEVEKLLRHGAYDIFNEDKAGTAEAESNDFVQQDIDSILQRFSRKVVHDNTGSQSNAAGGTFSKASFKVAKSPDANGAKNTADDVDIEDPDFWKKMLGDAKAEEASSGLKKRRRTETNYAESSFTKVLDESLFVESVDSDDDGDEDEDFDETSERTRWGGSADKNEWRKEDVEKLVRLIGTFGYMTIPWDDFEKRLGFSGRYSSTEIKRMTFSVSLLALIESAEDDAMGTIKRLKQQIAEAKQSAEKTDSDGGVLASLSSVDQFEGSAEQLAKSFSRLWENYRVWASRALADAVSFARGHEPREADSVEKALHPDEWKSRQNPDGLAAKFNEAWPSLKNRGWKADVQDSGDQSGKTRYEYEGKQYWSHESVLKAAKEEHADLKPMCERILELHDASRRKSVESNTKERESDLSLNNDNVEMDRLRKFLEKYAPLQLLADRAKPRKTIRLSRKMLSTCSLMDNASALVSLANAWSGDSNAIKRLEKVIAVDKRALLPHPLWNSRHDAVLIHAIMKHGWIDQDSQFRAIAGDSAIKWGQPFEIEEVEPSTPQAGRKQDITELRRVCRRAASFLDKHKELLDEYVGIDQATIKRVYGLTRLAPPSVQQNGGASTNTEVTSPLHQSWTVDESAFTDLVETNDSASPKSREPVDLPTSKDLQRRARVLLAKRVSADGSSSETKQEPAPKPSHGFAVLDQSAVPNVFLAELFRGIIKAKISQKQNRKLCAAAVEEAWGRVDDLEQLLSSNKFDKEELSKSLAEMKRIAQHAALVQRNFMKAIRQSKNVLRVILGEDPHSPRSNVENRNGDESLFPTEKSVSTFTQLQTKTKQTKPSKKLKSQTWKTNSNEASGIHAIAVATKKLYVRSERDQKQIANYDGVLDLTEIETCILSVACSRGLPLWTPDWQMALSAPVSDVQCGGPYSWSWLQFGQAISKLASDLLASENERLKELKKIEKSSSSPDLFNAKRMQALKERAVYQAAEYATEPDTLAKKTIMMMAKINRYMGKPIKYDYGLDHKVMACLDADIQHWASSLDLLDNVGRPLGFTAVDFIDDLPEPERTAIEISAILDKKGSRGIMSQTALMSQLRSIFLSCIQSGSKDQLLDAAASNVASRNWDAKPPWWGKQVQGDGSTIQHERLLLERLLRSGFEGVLDDERSYGLADVVGAVNFRSSKLTHADIQIRASQLAGELHNLEQQRKLEERRQRRASKSTPASLSLTTSSPVKWTAPGMSLHSHYAPQQGSVQIGFSPTNGGAASKRKEGGYGNGGFVDLTPSESPEKKHRSF